jgi:competence protein ComEC
MTTSTGYDPCTASTWHPGREVLPTGVAAALVVGTAWHAHPARLLAIGLAVGLVGLVGLAGPVRAPGAGRRSVGVVVLLVVTLAGGGWRGGAAWADLAPDRLGPYAGWVEVVTDPAPVGPATRVVVEVDGERFETFIRRRGMQARAGDWRAGELLLVHGERRHLGPGRVSRVAAQHVVGAFELDWVSDVRAGPLLATASNRVRDLVERGAATLPAADAALLRGLVVGDDRDQPPAMVDAFRVSGLSHLTAVSGQNVAFVLAAAGPLLRRLRTGPRLAGTLVLIAWFVALTRFEPSILRAGVMAGLAAVAGASGRERAPGRLLALAVSGLVLVDPLLVWSVGFWLSVGATLGVCQLGPRLAAHLGGGRVALALGVTLGAQAGVAAPSLLAFGRLPLVSVVTNPLAVPVAGVVMLYGLPAAIVAGAVPAIAPLVMAPAGLGVRWVDTVARLGAWAEPDPPITWAGWLAVAAVVLVAWRSPRRPALAERDARA